MELNIFCTEQINFKFLLIKSTTYNCVSLIIPKIIFSILLLFTCVLIIILMVNKLCKILGLEILSKDKQIDINELTFKQIKEIKSVK